MDFLITHPLWWHWVIFGIVLVVAEIIVPLFIVIWFGFAAILVGIVALLFVTSFIGEFGLWILLSVVLLFIWFTFFAPQSITESGQADYRLDTKGIVTQSIPHAGRGKVHFDIPVLGSSEWHATADQPLEKGTVVRIEDVSGQLIKVKKDH